MRRWSLAKTLPSLRAGSGMSLRSEGAAHQWGMSADNQLLYGWIGSMRERPWPRADALAAITIVCASWAADWAAIQTDAPRLTEVSRVVLARCELLDRLFHLVTQAESSRKPTPAWRAARVAMDLVEAQTHTLASAFWRVRLHRAIAENDERALARIEAEVCTALITTSESNHARHAAHFLVDFTRHSSPSDSWCPGQVVSVLVSQLASLSEQGLRQAAPLITLIVDRRPDWLNEANRRLIEAALRLAPPRLAYGAEGDIDPNATPWLRQLLASLLHRWRSVFAAHWDAALESWLDELTRDPLPEVRRKALG
jgi:hypothetical protein